MIYSLYKFCFWLIIFFYVPTQFLSAQQQISNPELSQVFRSIAEINEQESIQYLIEELFLPETAEDINRVEIIDVSNIGFGTNDILIFYPTQNVYKIEDYPPDLTEMMRNWSIQEQRRDATNNLTADYFYPAHADTLPPSEIPETQIELAQNSFISDIIASLDRNYEDTPISMRFERNEDSFVFQMWDYNEDAFSFSPRPRIADSVAVNDFLYVLYSDSTVVADTTLFDILYINKSVEETIYVPPVDELEPRIQTQNLPGSNSFPETQVFSNSANVREE